MADNTGSEAPPLLIKPLDIEDPAIQNYQVPTYTNFFQVWHFGTDVFIDLGLLTVESLVNRAPESAVPVAFHDRFVMGASTFALLVKQLNQTYETLQANGVLKNESTASQA